MSDKSFRKLVRKAIKDDKALGAVKPKRNQLV